MTAKQKKNAKLGNTVKIYDVVSHRSFFVVESDIKSVQTMLLISPTWRVWLKKAASKKTPCQCGFFVVGKKTSCMVNDILKKRKSCRKS